MRGKGWQVGFQHASERITPACAGKSPASGPGCGKTGDHPRVCGEKTRYQNLKTTIQGSPPRVRGKVQPAAAGNPAERITPACAGKRIYDTVRYMGLYDHPRVCGEKFGISCNPSLIGGSPPRVRGKAAWLPFMRITRGITPACAGKSRFHCGVLYPLWDHPRVCGEKRANLSIRQSNQGSPPRVRGKGPA